MKKAIIFLLIGIMIISMAACGRKTVENTASAGESSKAANEEKKPVSGGWNLAESPAVTDEIRTLIRKATEKLTGADYEPVAYIGSQTVAGTNHAILCLVTPVSPQAVGSYAIVILYEDPDGNTEVAEILTSQAGSEVLPEAGELTGGWEKPETPVVTSEAADALAIAAKKLDGAEYRPLALLASQVVAGMNYSILCQVTPVTPEAEASYVIVHIYADLDGGAEMTDTFEFTSE